MSMKHLATIEVTGSAQDVQFSNISQDYTDLQVYVSAAGRTTGGTDAALVAYTVPGQSSSLSTWANISGTSSNNSSANTAAYPIVGTIQHVSGTNNYGSVSIYIPNYTSSTNKKVFSYESVTENNSSTAYQSIGQLLLNYTSPITFLGFGDGSAGGGLKVGSIISLYGIKRPTTAATSS